MCFVINLLNALLDGLRHTTILVPRSLPGMQKQTNHQPIKTNVIICVLIGSLCNM